MSFRLSNGAREYFIDMLGSAKLRLWDPYYLCLLAGFIHGKITVDPKEDDGLGGTILGRETEFIDKFIIEYEPHKWSILGALAAAEIERRGIDVDSEKDVRLALLSLFDSGNPQHLSTEGFELLNLYAESGFRYIRSSIVGSDDFPLFMKNYIDKIIIAND
jgi:hypothetical protein